MDLEILSQRISLVEEQLLKLDGRLDELAGRVPTEGLEARLTSLEEKLGLCLERLEAIASPTLTPTEAAAVEAILEAEVREAEAEARQAEAEAEISEQIAENLSEPIAEIPEEGSEETSEEVTELEKEPAESAAVRNEEKQSNWLERFLVAK